MSIDITQIKNGDVGKFTSISIPLVYHYGVFIHIDSELYVMHNGTKGARIESYKDFTKNRKLKKVLTSTLSGTDKKELLQRFENYKHENYNLVNNDCQDFIEKITGDNFNFKYKQNTLWLSVFAISAIVILGIRQLIINNKN
jgi:hypothetical protein